MKKTVFITITAALVFALCSCAFNFDLLNDKPLHREDTTVINGTPLVCTTDTEGAADTSVNIPNLPGLSAEWPDNELTKLVPKPGFSVSNVSEEDGEFAAVFSGVTKEQMRAYAEKVKEAGFNTDVEVTDQNYAGIDVYAFSASNADGVTVSLSLTAGIASMAIKK